MVVVFKAEVVCRFLIIKGPGGKSFVAKAPEETSLLDFNGFFFEIKSPGGFKHALIGKKRTGRVNGRVDLEKVRKVGEFAGDGFQFVSQLIAGKTCLAGGEGEGREKTERDGGTWLGGVVFTVPIKGGGKSDF